MALYLIGDVQGCDDPLAQLLAKVGFSPSRDRLIVLGDLVNRGPQSLAVVRRLMAMGSSAECLLGNHDLHALAVAYGIRPMHRSDTLHEWLAAPDRAALIDWMRQRPLALSAHGWLLVHAGVLPQWTTALTLSLAHEVEQLLRGPGGPDWLGQMYGNQPDHWRNDWPQADRWRVVVNALTRLRFCTADGVMDFATKDTAALAPPGLMPWFDVPGRATADTPIAFGHWSTLGLVQRPGLLALDTGCVWGGCLSTARLGQDGQIEGITQVNCPAAQTPGQ